MACVLMAYHSKQAPAAIPFGRTLMNSKKTTSAAIYIYVKCPSLRPCTCVLDSVTPNRTARSSNVFLDGGQKSKRTSLRCSQFQFSWAVTHDAPLVSGAKFVRHTFNVYPDRTRHGSRCASVELVFQVSLANASRWRSPS